MLKNRFEAFTDGVFAIVITLLVLDVKFPEVNVSSNVDLINTIKSTLPNIFTYILTFLIVGIFWVAHHRIFVFVKEVNHFLLWSNIFYLMTVCIIPYPASIISKYPFYSGSVIFYSSILFLCGMQHFLFLFYIKRHREYLEKNITDKIMSLALKISCVGPSCYLLAIAISFYNPAYSFVFLVIPILFYIFIVHIFTEKFTRSKINPNHNI